MAHPSQSGNTSSPRAVAKGTSQPVRRFLLAGYTALSIVAAVLSWHLAPSALIPVLAILLIASLCVVLLAKAVQGNSSHAAQTFLWIVIVSVTALLALFISAAFFGVPTAGTVVIARMLDSPELLSIGSSAREIVVKQGNSAQLASEFSNALDVPDSADRYTRQQALAKRPSLRVEGVLTLPRSEGAPITLVANVLEIDAPGVLLTDGSKVRIEVNKIISSGGAIRSFGEDPVPSEPQNGRSGGRVELTVYDRIVGQLSVNLSGGSGGIGAPGRAGGNGRNGEPGEHSAQSLFGCQHGGGRGGDGQPGNNGDDGGPGFQGGDGGTLVVIAPRLEATASAIALTSASGRGGRGGPGGPGGHGGQGGSGGSGGGYCGGGPSGTNGPDGSPGRQGPDGPTGATGLQTLKRVE